jgi:Domain of unknown function (DUF4389)
VAELTTGAYPISLTTVRPPSSSRFWAIPIIGILIKAIILIPHAIILYVLGIVLAITHLVIWIWVLFGARYPDWAFGINAGYIRWFTRVYLYGYGLNDTYPAFSMDAPGDIFIARPERSSRFWAIPIIGIFVKYIILIPHLIVLYALSIAVAACQLVIWIWVLFGGEYPQWAFTLVGGFILWTARVYSFGLGLTDSYPPFSFS